MTVRHRKISLICHLVFDDKYCSSGPCLQQCSLTITWHVGGRLLFEYDVYQRCLPHIASPQSICNYLRMLALSPDRWRVHPPSLTHIGTIELIRSRRKISKPSLALRKPQGAPRLVLDVHQAFKTFSYPYSAVPFLWSIDAWLVQGYLHSTGRMQGSLDVEKSCFH